MRLHFLAEADFVRPTDDDDDVNRGGGDGTSQLTSHIRGYFHTCPVHISAAYETQFMEFSAILTELNNTVDQFTCHGSGYVMSRMTKLTAVMVPFNLLTGGGGSSYIRNMFRTKTTSIVAPSNFPSIRNSFQTSSAITLTLRFTVWRMMRRTSLSRYYTFRHACIHVRNESAYSC